MSNPKQQSGWTPLSLTYGPIMNRYFRIGCVAVFSGSMACCQVLDEDGSRERGGGRGVEMFGTYAEIIERIPSAIQEVRDEVEIAILEYVHASW